MPVAIPRTKGKRNVLTAKERTLIIHKLQERGVSSTQLFDLDDSLLVRLADNTDFLVACVANKQEAANLANVWLTNELRHRGVAL